MAGIRRKRTQSALGIAASEDSHQGIAKVAVSVWKVFSFVAARVSSQDRKEMMMTETQVNQGANFNGFHAGAKENWADFQLERPVVPVRVEGKPTWPN